jgi:hypothetical protein
MSPALATTSGGVAVLAVAVLLLGLAAGLLLAHVFDRRAAKRGDTGPDPDDDGDGKGGGGPRGGGDPPWWPDFERDLAAYLRQRPTPPARLRARSR